LKLEEIKLTSAVLQA